MSSQVPPPITPGGYAGAAPPVIDPNSLRLPGRAGAADLSWLSDRDHLKRWLLAYLAAWLGGAALWIVGAAKDVGFLAGTGVVLFLVAVVPYIVTLVFSYRVQDKLHKAGLYKHGAWHVLVGGLLLNPWFLGWAIPVSVLHTANQIRKSLPTKSTTGAAA